MAVFLAFIPSFRQALLIVLLVFFKLVKGIPIFVFEHFRHGARGSIFVVPSNYVDNYNISWYGNGEWTGIGMRMHYWIGVRSREKYKNLVSETYDPREMYVYSTDQNRTILSAQSQLLGMFPPESGWELNEIEKSIAIPPHPLTKEMEREIKKLKSHALPQKLQLIPINWFSNEAKKNFLLTEASECPAMKQIKHDYQNKKIVTEFYASFNETYGAAWLKFFNKSNDPNFIFNYYNMLGITDHFISGYAHSKNLTMLKALGINLEQFYADCKQFKTISLFDIESDEEIGVMAMSPTMLKIVKWMVRRIEKDIRNDTTIEWKKPKFVMYSGHDYTVVPMEQFLNKAFGTHMHYPEFAANQFFELHRVDYISSAYLSFDNYYVEYYYNGELGLNITFNSFRKRIQEIAWSKDQINSFCKVKTINNLDIISSSTFAFAVLSILVIIIRRQRKEKLHLQMVDHKANEIANKEKWLLNAKDSEVVNVINQNR